MAFVGVSLLAGACTGDSDDDGAGPTPTPLVVSVSTYYSQTATKDVLPGECWGLTIAVTGDVFDDTVTITPTDAAGDPYEISFTVAGQSGAFPFLTVAPGGASVTLGAGDPSYPCLNYGFRFWPTDEDYGLLVRANGKEGTILPAFHVQAVPDDTGNLGQGEATRADSLPAANEFDIWGFTSGGTSTVAAVYGTGAAFNPDVSMYTTAGSGTLFNIGYYGYDAVIRPFSAGLPHKVVVAAETAKTTGGFDYTLILSTSGTLVADNGSDLCANGQAQRSTGTYYISAVVSTNFQANYNPNGALACADRHVDAQIAGDGVRAPGRDTTYRVAVPAGRTLIAAAMGANNDTVLYLLPDTGAGQEALNCPATPATCTAAADIFGALDTDGLRYTNPTGATQNFYLVIDDFLANAGGPLTVFIDIR